MLQRIDDWIAEGVLGGEQLNAADLQIGTSLRLLMTLDDLAPALEQRPAGELALRVAPDYPGPRAADPAAGVGGGAPGAGGNAGENGAVREQVRAAVLL